MRKECRWCGAKVDEFFDEETGLRRHLEPDPLPITVDITAPEWRHRIWQDMGERLGWAPKFTPAGRNWRELRAEHSCPDMPKHRKTSTDSVEPHNPHEKESRNG